MTLSDGLLFAVVLLFGLNHLLIRLPGWERHRRVFWTLQGLNLIAATGLMAIGIPDLVGGMQIFNWVLGLLLTWRIVSNNNRLVSSVREARRQARAAERQRQDEIRAALHRDRPEADPAGDATGT